MRIFLAVDIPDSIKDKISEVAKDYAMPGIHLSRKDTYHITLQFLGDLEKEKIDAIKDILSSLKIKPFTVKISGISHFDPTRIYVIFAYVSEGSAELKSIYNQIDVELKKKGLSYKREKHYSPHVTIARVKSIRSKANLLSMLDKHKRENFGSFDVSSIYLKESILKSDGPIHNTLYELKL